VSAPAKRVPRVEPRIQRGYPLNWPMARRKPTTTVTVARAQNKTRDGGPAALGSLRPGRLAGWSRCAYGKDGGSAG